MLPRILSIGALFFAGTQLLSAADPLIPPAPTGDTIPPTATVPAIPAPPTPHVPIPSKIGPVPESAPTNPAQQKTTPAPIPPLPVPSATTPAVSPNQAVPQPIPENQPAIPVPGRQVSPIPDSQGSMNGFGPGFPSAVPNQFTPVPYGQPVQPGPYGQYGAYSLPGGPQYNSFATVPNVIPYFHTGPAGGEHPRFPYYSYRRPWYTPGPVSRNVNIVW